MNSFHNMNIKDSVKALGSSLTKGLTTEQAAERLLRDGLNTTPTAKKRSILVSFFMQFKDFMVIVLLIAALISFFTELYRGDSSFIDPIIIIAIVVLNAIIGTMQESKAEKAIEELNRLTAPHCTVKRDGEYITIETDKLVLGDIVSLSQGSIVPADCRLLSSYALKVSEAALTGESTAVDKLAEVTLQTDTPLCERCNMVYMGTSITMGRCEAMVCACARESEMGNIAAMLGEKQDDTTPLQKRLNEMGKLLGMGAIFICLIIFVIGIIRKQPVFDMFMTSVSLAVAAIPEGLPAIVTIVLAMGVKRMAEKRAVVRRLPAVEALGRASVICSDKTGTLTQNKMEVAEVSSENKELTLMLTALCNDASDTNGEPTEVALINAAQCNGLVKAELDCLYPRLSEYPFDPTLKRMTTVHCFNNKNRYITKGSTEHILPLCTHYLTSNGVEVLSAELRKRILAFETAMSSRALRVLAVAYKDTDSSIAPYNAREYAEYGLTFCGLAGLLDPPRPEVKGAVEQCMQAGIHPVMITGDSVNTAMAIATRCGILRQGDKALSGTELDALNDEALEKVIDSCSVFARVTPAHKVRIVRAFQSKGHICAMTGDGINDAPALKTADIGCAMGMTGTDVAKGAADIVLTDDNFATIIDAVHEGRNIYENIKKAVHFLLSSNIGEIITVFVAMVMSFDAPLVPIQLLWVNLVTDSLPAIALGVDPCDKDIMERPPIKDNALFSKELWVRIGLEGAMIGMLSLVAFAVGSVMYTDVVIGRTMAFAVLSISQLVHAFNMRSEHSLFNIDILGNKMLVASLVIGTLMQIAVIQIPTLATIFKVTALTYTQWLWVIMSCITPVVLVELEKKFN
jgi:Ca2+-transporting ATPase